MADTYKIAVASSDGIVVNQHFGRADKFYIYETDDSGVFSLLETRSTKPVCQAGNHDEHTLCENISRFTDCKYLLVSRIGNGAANIAEQAGITAVELPGMIDESIKKLVSYEKVQNLIREI